MFGDVGMGEIAVLLVLALFIFGPHRLPKMAAELGRGLRQVRRMALNARRDLEDGLGPEMRDFDVSDLNPRSFVRKHLLEDFDDEDEPRANGHRRAGDAHRTSGTGAVNRLDYGERPPYDPDAT